MANCDFLGDCECSDCRSISLKLKCAKCGGISSFELDGIAKYEAYKGKVFSEFLVPDGFQEAQRCTNCGVSLADALKV